MRKYGPAKTPHSDTFYVVSWCDNFCADQKGSEKWKKKFRISQESFEKLCTDLIFRKPKPDFKIQF